MRKQSSQHDSSQWKIPHAVASFRWPKLSPVNTLTNLEDATFKIYVTPSQSKELSSPDSSEGTHQNHRTDWFGQFTQQQEQLPWCRDSPRTGKRFRWQPNSSDRVDRDEVPLHRRPVNSAYQVAKVFHRV